jgi:hypothetical protein
MIVKKIRDLNDFVYSTQFGVVGFGHVGEEFSFDVKTLADKVRELPELFIEIEIKDGEHLKFEIFSNDIETKALAFNNVFFDNDELAELAKIFGFKIVKNPFFPDKSQGTLSFVHEDYENFNSLIKRHYAEFYVLIYASRRSQPARSMSEDFYGDNVYYVHGIWQVELRENQIDKISPKPNT